jgi:hypothetical protein
MIKLRKQVAVDYAQNLIICITTQRILKARNPALEPN